MITIINFGVDKVKHNPIQSPASGNISVSSAECQRSGGDLWQLTFPFPRQVSASVESTSAGMGSAASACSQDDSFLGASGQIMVTLSAAVAICLCLACGALIYVRLIRDSGHWEPQPAYHEGVSGSNIVLYDRSALKCETCHSPYITPRFMYRT